VGAVAHDRADVADVDDASVQRRPVGGTKNATTFFAVPSPKFFTVTVMVPTLFAESTSTELRVILISGLAGLIITGSISVLETFWLYGL
jgi:hypothetical protein